MANSARFNSDKCPICGNSNVDSGELKPFCSKRCQQVDLGVWFTEGYSIPAVEIDEEDLEFPEEYDN